MVNYNHPLPIGSMYGIYANIWGILMVNVTIYSIHGSYGLLTIINQLDQNSMDFEADLGLGDLGLAYGRRRRPVSSPVVLGFWAQKKPCQTYEDLLGCAAPLVRVDI